jgi:hypothetical protein
LLLRFSGSVVPLLVAALIVSACESEQTASTITTPTPVTKTDTFAGRVTVNGATTFTFATVAGGAVTATVKTVEFVTPPPQPDPDNPVTVPAIGFALGRVDGNSCILSVTNEQAVAGSVISAVASGAGNLCLRVYDVGSVTAPLTFSVDVEHP